MTPPDNHPDDLVTLTTRPTEFAAANLVVVLNEAGIDAVAFGAVQTLLPLSERIVAVPVQVRQQDLERAREVLRQNVADSVDLDWDEIDVGERVDDLPLTQREGLPLAAVISVIVAIALLAAAGLGLIINVARVFF